jgi:hypothetical protein
VIERKKDWGTRANCASAHRGNGVLINIDLCTPSFLSVPFVSRS